MVLMRSSMAHSRAWPTSRSVPLGSRLRSTELFCSLVGRCQGLWGSQKYTSRPVSASMRGQRAISLPLSQVSVLAMPDGTRANVAATAEATLSAL